MAARSDARMTRWPRTVRMSRSTATMWLRAIPERLRVAGDGGVQLRGLFHLQSQRGGEPHAIQVILRYSAVECPDIRGAYVAEVEAIEPWRHLEGPKRRAVELGSGLEVNPAAGTSEEIHVDELRPLPGCAFGAHRCHEGPSVSFQIRELLLGPGAAYSRGQTIGGAANHPTTDLKMGGRGLGISSHVRPSSVRPPDFGVRPPHCLKKKDTP